MSEQEVAQEFNRFLGDSFDRQFKIVNSNYSAAFGDDVFTVDVKFSKEGYKKLRSILQNEEVTNFEWGFQFRKEIPLRSGYDYFSLTVPYDAGIIHLQFGRE